MSCEIIKVADAKTFIKVGRTGCSDGTQIIKVKEDGVVVKFGNTIVSGGAAADPDAPFSGEDIETYPAGESITAFQPVALVNGELFTADNTDPNHRGKVLGLALISANSAGINVSVRRTGLATNSSWAFTTGSFIFIGANGLLTETAPATGFLQSIGHALNANNLVLNIKQAIRRI